MGEAAGCTTEFMSGAFFLRSSGSLLENCAAWIRFNLWWGGKFPSWPGEIYWLMRKREHPHSPADFEGNGENYPASRLDKAPSSRPSAASFSSRESFSTR
jgi:hypothetical protein